MNEPGVGIPPPVEPSKKNVGEAALFFFAKHDLEVTSSL